MQRLCVSFSIFICLLVPAFAQEVPGTLSGTIGDQSVEFPLDCRLWTNEQSLVFGAGDNGSGRDNNGDSYAMSYSYLRGANALTDMFVTINEVRFNLGPVFGSDDPTGGWIVDDDGARLSGAADNFGNPVAVDLVLDCAARPAAARGFSGQVTGVFDGISVDSPLFCGNWMPGGFSQAATEEGQLPYFEVAVYPNGTEGFVTATTQEHEYKWPVAPLTGTAFEATEDIVAFSAELIERVSGREYAVNLQFDCSDR